MAGAELVVLRLGPHEEPRDPSELTKRLEPSAAAGEHLVDVRLMSGIPDDLVARRIEHAMQGDGELDGAKARANVATGLLHALHGEVADLGAEREELVAVQDLEVAGVLDPFEDAHKAILPAVFDLSRRAVVLTGATGNIGPAVIRAYLAQGAHVALAVRDGAKGEKVRGDLGALAGTAEDPLVIVLAADPGDRPAMERAVEHILRTWGRLDVIANLVGGYATSDAVVGDLAAYRASWDQKVATAVTATTACLAPMRARGYGRVVSVASFAALKGEKGAAGYAMANAALVRWTESLAEDLKREGITANCVLPRIIDTPENRAAMPKADPSRWATADEVAAVMVFLSSDEASGITGASIPIGARI